MFCVKLCFSKILFPKFETLQESQFFLFSRLTVFYCKKTITSFVELLQVKATWIPCKLCGMMLPSRLAMVSHKAKIHSKADIRDSSGKVEPLEECTTLILPTWKVRYLFENYEAKYEKVNLKYLIMKNWILYYWC